MDSEILKADFSAMLSDWGEKIVFRPASGRTRTILAIVDRMPAQRINGMGQVYAPAMQIEVLNDQIDGISSMELDGNGADRVDIAQRIGGTSATFGVYIPAPGSRGAFQDAGALTLELR